MQPNFYGTSNRIVFHFHSSPYPKSKIIGCRKQPHKRVHFNLEIDDILLYVNYDLRQQKVILRLTEI